MKELKKTLKIFIISVILICNNSIEAQELKSNRERFIRVFNLEGKKVAKGKIKFVNDTVLGIQNKGKLNEFKVTEIGKIKTKRSGGHNVLMGSAIGASVGVILGVSTADPDAWVFGYSASEGALGFGALGAVGGAAIGGMTAGFKDSETFMINGKKENWKLFIARLSN